MNRKRVWLLGSGASLLAAGSIVTAAAVSGRVSAPACPTGWAEITPPSLADASPLRACARTAANAPAQDAATIALYRTSSRAPTMREPALQSAVALARSHGASAPSDTATRAAAANGRLDVVTHTLDAGELPLQADVYLVAAGHRFGLLNIVHTPDAPFARAENTAAWMSTIQGVSPWGAPDAGPIRAQCPEGFDARPVDGARAVVRCMSGLGTANFTLVSLSWDEGGLGSETERTQVASAIAARVASSQGATARVVEGPLPFTLARNVDAMRTRVETGEHVPVSLRALAAVAVNGSDHVVGWGVGPSDQAIVPAMAEMFLASGATRRPPWLDDQRGWALAGAFLVLGMVITALVARGRERA